MDFLKDNVNIHLRVRFNRDNREGERGDLSSSPDACLFGNEQ